MAKEVAVKGLKELDAFLKRLPAKVEGNILRGALRAGAKVILTEAKVLVPVGPPNAENVRLYGGHEGALRDSIRISTSRRKGDVKASVKAGGKNKKTGADVFYAHFIEFGTVKGNAIPFLRPSLDSKQGEAVVAVGNNIKKKLATKHGINAPEIKLEGDE